MITLVFSFTPLSGNALCQDKLYLLELHFTTISVGVKNDCRYFPNSQTQIKTIHDMVTYSSPRFASVREVSLSSRWLILFELRAKRQKVPIGSCWSNFLATRYHEPTE